MKKIFENIFFKKNIKLKSNSFPLTKNHYNILKTKILKILNS